MMLVNYDLWAIELLDILCNNARWANHSWYHFLI